MLRGLVKPEVSKYIGKMEKGKCEAREQSTGLGWELYRARGMVGESYEATSWRSGPLSIVSARKKYSTSTLEKRYGVRVDYVGFD